MLEHAKIVWLIRIYLLTDQSHWTHILYWNMQRLFKWSEHSFWEIKTTGLTRYVGTCKDCLSDQNIPFEGSEPLDLHTILEHAKNCLSDQNTPSKIRATGLTFYIIRFILIRNAVDCYKQHLLAEHFASIHLVEEIHYSCGSTNLL